MELFTLTELVLLVLFFFLSGSYSGLETAITRLRKHEIVTSALPDHKIHYFQNLLDRPRPYLTTILVANTLCKISISILIALAIFVNLDDLTIISLPITMIFTCIGIVILLIINDIFPKSLGIKNHVKYASMLYVLLKITKFTLTPLVKFFGLISQVTYKILGMDLNQTSQLISAEEIMSIVNKGQQAGIIEKEEEDMINGIFELSKTIVREIMTPRTDAVCLNNKSTVKDAIKLIIEKGHSRVPLFEDKVDNIIGIIYAKDLLHEADINQNIQSYSREAIFIPETKSVEDLLHQMQKSKFHIAIVVDEYGGMSGLVTLEDIIEEIVGEIQDEYDQDERPEILEMGPNHYIVDAKMNIDDLGKSLDINFPEADYDTVGGFILSLFGNFPETNSTATYEGFQFTVKDIKKRRILNIEIKK